MAPPTHVPKCGIVRAGTSVESVETRELRDVTGEPAALVDQAPPLLARLTVADARPATYLTAPSADVLQLAGELFATAELNGLRPDDYCEVQARCSGIPLRVAQRCLDEIREACARAQDRLDAERPPGTSDNPPAGGIGGVWKRRGDVLGVIAPSNNPGVHVIWIEALALGYRVIIRPGGKDPFTPARLIAALLSAGVDPSFLSLLPGGHSTGRTLVEQADLSIVFGDDASLRSYAQDASVIARGPGRSKILHTGEITASALDVICDSVAYDGGLRCTNASAVFTDADHAELAEAMAERLACRKAAAPQSPEAELPVRPTADARALRQALTAQMDGAVDMAALHHPRGDPLADLGDGSSALLPSVLRCDETTHPGSTLELPFPCVWVLPWDRRDGAAPLRRTLSLTVLSEDTDLVASALREPSIRKVLAGGLPTYASSPTSPHDGYLSQDLMEVRAYGATPALRDQVDG